MHVINTLKLIGFIFDVIGTILIAVAVLRLHDNINTLAATQDLIHELNDQTEAQIHMTGWGLGLVVAGILCVIIAESLIHKEGLSLSALKTQINQLTERLNKLNALNYLSVF